MKKRKSKKGRTPRKERKQTKVKKRGEKFQEIFQKFLIEKETELNISFNQSVKDIPPIYYQYNLKDVATSIFISSLWLPNISSLVKHQLLTAILASLKPNEFRNSKSINSYSEFKEFLEKVYALLPQFPMLEDYIPELDWGNIKFYHEENIYKIFYGQELSNVYDYLILFQMLYLPFDNQYNYLSGRSPKKELTLCLRLQDATILNINHQPKLEEISELSPGHIEVPSVTFWENAKQFYVEFDVSQIFDEMTLKEYSIEIGTLPHKQLDCNQFQDMVHNGKMVPKYFITYERQYLPILPRRYSAILFDSWTKVFEDYHKEVVKNSTSYTLIMSAELHKYIRARIKCDFLEPAVSAVTAEGKPHETLFSSVFISKNRLILVYLMNPYYSAEETQKEIETISGNLKEAIKLIKISPQTLALHLERKNVQFKSNNDEPLLKPELIVVIPQTSTALSYLKYPANFPGKIMFMDVFLGIVDELDNKEMFSSFLEYLEENEQMISKSFLSLLDIFGSFKDSYGVLLEGAVDYNMVVLDPHWGSNFRYKSLSGFWSIYPENHFFDHPRSWRLKKETETRIRLDARGYLGSALYCKIGSTHVFINAPFNDMTYEQCLISNMMMECLEDRMSKNIHIITRHRYFQSNSKFQVFFFPLSLISSNKKYDHLKHLITNDAEKWRSDIQMFMPGLYGIRTVFNDKLLFNALETVNDCSIEVDLSLEIIKRLDSHIPDENVGQILKLLEEQKKGSPRFKLMKASNKASFPQFINPCKPQIVDFKKARKRISELTKNNGFNEGSYSLEDAKVRIDEIKRSVIEEIDKEVSKYNFVTSIPYLVARNDALTNEYEKSILQMEKSLEHEVDFNRAEHYSKDETEYVGMHKNYRYLLEKFVQLQPTGTKGIDKDKFQYLIALIDWLHVLYSASDSLWYGLDTALGMKVSNQYLVEVEYDESFSQKQKIFAEERAKEKLGVGINLNDDVKSSRTLTDFVSALDLAFKEDLGFTFSNMITLLKVLSFWTEYCEGCKCAEYYTADETEIRETCYKAVNEYERDQTKMILEFLTLRSEDVIRILGQATVCDDIPIWEHRKRFSRYAIRPLIYINGKYYWGAHSTRKSGIIWSGSLYHGSLPADLESIKIQNEIDNEKRLIENALEKKTYDIIRRYTSYVIPRCMLHERDPEGGHPIDLGDYDVLAFYAKKNIILNLECKDNLPPFCLKDATRLKRKIFGEGDGDEGHFNQINKRKDYLVENVQKISKALNWPIDANNLPKIVTIYLTRNTYWWTRFPPKNQDVTFLRAVQLSNFVESL